MTTEACEWIKKHKGSYPSNGAKDETERKYAIFISKKRRAKKGMGRGAWYESDQKIVERYGYPDLFDTIDLERASNEMTTEVCEWIKKHKGSYPSKKAKDETERKYANFISNKRRAKKGMGRGAIFYESDQKIAERYGYPDLFN
jgi:non-homologous end joining protein Ku